MAAPDVWSKERLFRFLEEHAGDRLKMRLLAFWGRHPQARFAIDAIYCGLGCKKLDLNRALREMAEAGLLDTYHNNGVSFYSLTASKEERRPVLELASLGFYQWRLILSRRVRPQGERNSVRTTAQR